jgi:protein-tyrosine phosphatase
VTPTRIISLERGRNFRDLGGYPTVDGQRVKWRTLFRSGTLAHLTETDLDAVDALEIRAVIDLRTGEERQAEPHPWPRHPHVTAYSRDYVSSAGELRRLAEKPLPTGADARAAMLTIYRTLPYEQADAYRRLFSDASQGRLPLLFNCSAGKDRTGVAAALLLSVLGVAREVVVEDFVLTETAFNFRSLATTMNDQSPHSGMGRLPAEVLDALIAAHPDYLAAMFDEIDRRSGSLPRFLECELGIAAHEIDILRNHLLE